MEFEVLGKQRGFKLGPYTFKLINQLTGTKTIEEVFDRMKTGEYDFALSFYFCCAKHYAMSNKLPIDFEEVHVADWIEELGTEKMGEITKELFKVFILKNLPAPMTGQVLQSINGIT
jgi:hypothetical protein